jgi:peptide/nickel transport system substrate-binding protein
MALSRRFRIFYLIVFELAQKYTRALVAGFILGLVITVGAVRLYPLIAQQWLAPVDRIGLVGEFTPNNLPLMIQGQISMGLTTLAQDGSALPGLAESWTATDSGKTFIFTLKKDVLWHNGKPVEAKDVNYNIRNVSFTPIDTHTLEVKLDNPYSPFPTLVAKPLFAAGLRGFGPYKLAGIHLNGDKVSYLRVVPVDRKDTSRKTTEYRFYRTEAAAVLGYKLGEVDTLMDMTSSYDLSSWKGTEVKEDIKYNRVVALFFNLNDKLIAEKNIRQGLAYGVPKLAGEAAVSPISKNSWAYTDKVKKYTTDPVQAKKLLGAVVSASQSATLTLATFPSYESEAETIAKAWTDLGLPTSVRIVSSVPSDYQVLLSFQELPPDPDQYPFWHSTQIATNKTGFVNVKIDKLLEDGRQELDINKRKTIYADFQRRVVEDVPAAFLHYQTTYTVER